MTLGSFRNSKRQVAALAILGVLLNAWVLTFHSVSLATAGLTGSSAVLHCAHHEAGDRAKTTHQSKGNGCPVCAGLTALDLAVLAQPVLAQGQMPLATVSREAFLSFVLDHLPFKIFNRGPPLFA